MTTSTGCGSLATTLSLSLLVAVLTGCQGLESKGGGDPAPPHGSLSASPASLSFGKVIVGHSASLQGTLRATGATVTVSSVTGTNGDFAVKGVSFPATLEAGQSLSFTVTFTPQVSGDASTTLGFVSNADDSPALQSETGTGTPASHGSLSVSPASLSFGKVIVGQSASLQGSLRATGATITISSVSGTNGDFGFKGVSFPATLDAGQSLSFTVSFTPQVSGAASTTLSFVSSADDSPALQSESGTGTPAPQHSVDLSWNASKSEGVVGYNVYRKTDGDFSRINDALESSTSYEDVAVLAGATYYYAVTAVDSNGVESPPSKSVKAVIPTP